MSCRLVGDLLSEWAGKVPPLASGRGGSGGVAAGELLANRPIQARLSVLILTPQDVICVTLVVENGFRAGVLSASIASIAQPTYGYQSHDHRKLRHDGGVLAAMCDG